MRYLLRELYYAFEDERSKGLLGVKVLPFDYLRCDGLPFFMVDELRFSEPIGLQ